MPESHEPSSQAPTGGDALDTLVARAGEIGVVGIVNAILREALQEGASTVHLEPRASGGIVRCRVGGELRQMLVLRPELFLPVTARLKLMAGLDLGERPMPRQGRIPIEYRQEPCSITVATMPRLFGESLVLRIVDTTRGANWTWESLEFDAKETMQALLGRPQGLILFTGPPGSGKTAALFGALHALDAERLNIVAVMGEQPCALEGINLSAATPASPPPASGYPARAAGGPTAEAIRALAERDADVIGVDEAREWAEIEAALGAALAGHRVLAVFPASDVAGAIERLIGLGVSPRQLSAGLSGIVASRLARRVCPDCREVDHPSEESLRALAITPEQAATAFFARGKGCDDCRGTGCRGWAGLYQVLTIDAAVASLIAAGAAADRLRERLPASGLRSFRELGAEKARAGVIAVDEALRFIEE